MTIKFNSNNFLNNDIRLKGLASQFTSLILTTLLIILIVGCEENRYYQKNEIIDSIADTINTAESRQVFMTDGTGGYYFEDAFRGNGRSDYGYSRGERRILANWNLIDDAGHSLIADQEYSVAHPERIEFHYKSGLITTIKMAMGMPGLIVSFEQIENSAMVFRPQIDMRKLDLEETPLYQNYWDAGLDLLTISRSDSLGGWLAISSLQETRYRSSENIHRRTHEASRLIGSTDVSVAWSPGEFELRTGRSLTMIVGWGKDQAAAVENLENITIQFDTLSTERQQWAMSVLEPISIKCDDSNFVKAYAWARLVAAQMSVIDNGKEMLLTGIPNSPYPHGFYSAFSLLGLRDMGYSDERVISILKDVASYQNLDQDSTRYGMIPGAITEDGPEYKIPEIAGVVAFIISKLKTAQALDSASNDYFANVLARDLIGTSRFRLHNGMVYSKGDEYLLWDSNAASDRTGYTIESQLLFRRVMQYFDKYKEFELKPLGLALSQTKGIDNLDRRLKDGELMGYGQHGEFRIPSHRYNLIKPFILKREKLWTDLIQIDSGKVNQVSSSSFSAFLATYWSSSNYHKRSPDVMQNLKNRELIGKTGLRSMSPHSPDYNSEHVYLMPNSPAGTMTTGDIMVWSCGLLADSYWNVGAFKEIHNLLDQLTQRVLYQGVTGGLPEAEQPESDNILESSVGNSVFLASNAEYLRIIENRVLSIHIINDKILSIQPDFPESWGETELVLKNEFGEVVLHKIDPLLYRVTQVGISPYIELSLRVKFNISGEVGGALTSARIYPKEEILIHFETNKDGRWVGKTERK